MGAQSPPYHLIAPLAQSPSGSFPHSGVSSGRPVGSTELPGEGEWQRSLWHMWERHGIRRGHHGELGGVCKVPRPPCHPGSSASPLPLTHQLERRPGLLRPDP